MISCFFLGHEWSLFELLVLANLKSFPGGEQLELEDLLVEKVGFCRAWGHLQPESGLLARQVSLSDGALNH